MPTPRRSGPGAALNAERLAKCELFGEFTAEARRNIIAFSELRRLGAGQVLFSEGEPCGALHLLVDGAVKMNKVSPDGKEQVIRQLKPGQIFGAAPLFTPESSYPATALALRASRVLVVPKAPFIRFLKREPEMLLKVLGHVSQHLQQMMHLAETVSLDRVPKRVAAFLLQEAKRAGGPRQGQVLDLARSQSEWAAELGTVREVLGRVLQGWKKRGLLRVEPRRIVLLDPAGLRAEAEGA
jgi:CRP/FNR family transcriptional regulator